MRLQRALLTWPLMGLLLSACGAGWQTTPVWLTAAIDPGQQVQVWTAQGARVYHGARVDSVGFSGVPYHRPADCDSCRVIVPHSALDSVRVGSLQRGLWRTVGLITGIVLGWCALVCPAYGS